MFISDPEIIVRPRVLLGGDVPGALPLLDELADLDDVRRGVVALTGPAGSGKSTALRYLRNHWSDAQRVFLDEPELALLREHREKQIFYAARTPFNAIKHRRVVTLAPWTQDDAIEYLLAANREGCARVMERLRGMRIGLLEGNAELWRMVLDALCSDEEGDLEAIVLHRFADLPPDTFERVQKLAFVSLLSPKNRSDLIGREGGVQMLAQFSKDVRFLLRETQLRLLDHPGIQLVLATRLALQRAGERKPACYSVSWPCTLVDAVGATAAGNVEAIQALNECLAQAEADMQPVLASVLLKAQPNWKPAEKLIISLERAFLDRAQWSGADLEEARLAHVSFQGACLDGAKLMKANLAHANLARASLQGAHLLGVDASRANFSYAILDEADFEIANLSKANFSFAKMLGTNLRYATLDGANFQRASLIGARFLKSALEGANFDETDLMHADFSGAQLSLVKLNTATLHHACFDDAELKHCDLEYVSIRNARMNRARLNHALLTGSTLRDAQLKDAVLRDAGLADIDWEGADLRGVDFRGASFHMGNARSGLVNSVIACEGSKTGFYTDEYYEQSFKAPEAIRKANLRGADLRGALLEGVDFYLVDLRDAKLDAHALPDLRRCGAILESHV